MRKAGFGHLGPLGAAVLVLTATLFSEGSAVASSPTWGTAVSLAGPVWQFPAPVTGLGYAGPGRLWVFLSRRAILPPDRVWEVDTAHRRVLLRVSLGGAADAFGTSPDGAAYAVQGVRLAELWRGRRAMYRLPEGVKVVALSAQSHDAVWLAFRLGLTGRVEVGLYHLPDEVMTYAHHIAGMANEGVEALAAAPGGAWVVSAPRPVLYWVPAVGGPSTYTKLYATAFFPSDAKALAGIAVNAHGQGWLSGTATNGHRVVWHIAGVRGPGKAILLPGVVNVVAKGLAVAPNGIGYVGFSAVGGTSGYPGVAGVSPVGKALASVWRQLAIPGGGVGPLLLTPTGQLWGGMPFSRLVLSLRSHA